MDSSSGIQHADFARVSPAGKSNLTPIPSRRKLILVAPWCTAADCEVLGRLHGQCAQGMSLGVSPSAALLYCTAMHAENRNCSSCKGKGLITDGIGRNFLCASCHADEIWTCRKCDWTPRNGQQRCPACPPSDAYEGFCHIDHPDCQCRSCELTRELDAGFSGIFT